MLVIAVGNRSRGDDAIGPLLLDRLAARLAQGAGEPDIELLEDYQLQIEHALDLAGRRLVLFIDAGTGTAPPCTLYDAVAKTPLASHSTHAIEPAAVLACYRQINGEEPPPAYVLCVRGERFELGEAPSVAAHAHAEAAWQLLERLCAEPDADRWRALAQTASRCAASRPGVAGVSAAR